MVDGLHETVSAWVVRKETSITVLLTNHALPGHSIEAEHVMVSLNNMSNPEHVFVSRIDSENANARLAWEEMGAPAYPSVSQLDVLTEASSLVREKQPFKWSGKTVIIDINLPPHAVALIEVELSRESGEN